MNWENDPEFKRLKQCYIDSFPEKVENLKLFLRNRIENKVLFYSSEWLKFLHSLAGTAESYELPTVSTVSGKMEVILRYELETNNILRNADLDRTWMQYLLDLLTEVIRLREDPLALLSGPCMTEINRVYDRLPAEYKLDAIESLIE